MPPGGGRRRAPPAGAAAEAGSPDGSGVGGGGLGGGSLGGGSLGGGSLGGGSLSSADSACESAAAAQFGAEERAALEARAASAERELARAAEAQSALSLALAAEVGRLRLSNTALSSALDAERAAARGWAARLSAGATAVALPLVALALLALRSCLEAQLAQLPPPRRLLSGGPHAVERACAVAPQVVMMLTAALFFLFAAVLLRLYSWHGPGARPSPGASLKSAPSPSDCVGASPGAVQQSSPDSASSTSSTSTGVQQAQGPHFASSQPRSQLRPAPGESSSSTSASAGASRGSSSSSSSSSTVSRLDHQPNMSKCGVSLEFGLCTDHWLNFTAGLPLSVEDTAAFRAMSASEAATFATFKVEVRKRLAACAEIDREQHFTEPDDVTTLKFLQADKYDTALATERLLNTIVWRQKIDLDRLVRERPAAIETYRKLRVRRLMGHDVSGRPVFVERVGEFVASIGSAQARALSPQDWVDCCVHDMAHLICAFRASVKLGPPQMRQVFIADCAGVTVMQAIKSVKILREMARATGPNFPEMVDSVILVNVSSVVHSCWGLVKKVLDPVVVAKIQMHTAFPTAYVLRFLAKESLFAEYGGDNQAEYPHVVRD